MKATRQKEPNLIIFGPFRRGFYYDVSAPFNTLDSVLCSESGFLFPEAVFSLIQKPSFKPDFIKGATTNENF